MAIAPKAAAKKEASKVAEGKETKKAEPKPKAKTKAATEAMDKSEAPNMLGSLKASKDPAKQELVNFYKGLPRFDSQKAELLKKWKAD